MERLRVLHLEGNPQDAELVLAALQAGPWQCDVLRVETEEAFVSALGRGGFHLIISDFRLPGFDGKAALSIARKLVPETPFIFVSGTLGEDAAIESLTSGATDYILKDNFSRLIPAIQRAQADVREQLQRKKTQRDLELEATRLQNLFNNLDDVFFSFDTVRWRFLQLSPACQRITGFPATAFFENPSLWRQFIHSADHDVVAGMQRDLEAGNPCSCEIRIPRDRGPARWVEARLKSVLGRDGSLARVDGVLVDVTDRKRAEENLRESEEKYRQHFEECPDAILVSSVEGRFLDANPAAIELLGCASKTELLEAGSFLQFCQDPEDCAVFEQTVGRVGSVRDYELRLTRVDGGTVNVLVTAIAIRDSKGEVTGYRGIYRDVTEQRQIHDRFGRARRLERIAALAGDIASDLNNILAPLFTSVQQLKAEITSEDSSRVLDTLQASAIRGRELVKQVQVLGSGIDLTTPGGEGTSPLPGGNGELILIVDDAAATRGIVRAILETYGYRVVAAGSGADGLRLFQNHADELRLLLLDLQLPDMSGIQMADEIRRSHGYLPIVFMTAAGQEGDVQDHSLEKRSGRLHKPFNASSLLRALSGQLQLASRADQS